MNEDRRVQRTRELLQNALMELLETRDYDALTIQDVAERANVGRTTVYLHFESKEDLYRQAHRAEIARIAGAPLTRVELFADDPPDRMVAVYAYHWATRDVLRMVYFGKDAEVIHRQMRDQHSVQIATYLAATFAGVRFILPVDVLANCLAVSEMGLMMWWIEKHPPYTPEQMATHFHRLRRGSLREGLALTDVSPSS
ncbi:MAG: TetR/AcrR family transcriptional regulator [Anaerolineae bacterium]|nr:TetR/AcrR family transcriptional regulator [Anaerolineae bacterium]